MTASFDERSAQAQHVCFALDQVSALPPHTDNPSFPSEVRSACLESFFTNLRLLIEFTVREPDGRDISREDFTPQWSPKPSSQIDRLKEDWHFASQTVSHLSKARIPGPDFVLQNYDPRVLAAMAYRMVQVFSAFVTRLESIASPYFAEFDTALKDAEARLSPQLP